LPWESGELFWRKEEHFTGKPQRRFGKEFAAEAVRLVEVSGRTQREIARDLGVGLSTLARQAP
jgi:transposase-like protein